MSEADDVESKIEALARHMARTVYRYANEKELQAAILGDLDSLPLDWEIIREKHLNPGDVVDFYDPSDGIAIELKISATFGETINQCYRYMKSDDVHGLVLLTPSRRLFAQFRRRVARTLNDKPLWSILIRGEL